MLRYDNKVVVITGAGGGLGLCYAHFFASRGANIVLNDIAKRDGQSLAVKVSKELSTKYNVKVVPNQDSVEFGERIIEQAMKEFGRVDVLVNNAGILRDKSFSKMTPADWDIILKVHLTGAFRCTMGAWKVFRNQKYGRVINTSSGSGLYGNFGQANYSTAKMGLVGFTKTLAKEGAKYNIKVNAIAPIAKTQMTEGIMAQEILEAVKPDYIVPLVGVLAHEKCPDSGRVYEVGGGWIAELRLQRAEGATHKLDFTSEDVLKNWDSVSNYKNSTYPTELGQSFEIMYEKYEKNKQSGSSKGEQNNSGEQLDGKWKSEEIYKLMKAYVENGLAGKAVKKCNASYQVNLLDKPKGKVVFTFVIDLRQSSQKVHLGKMDKPDATFTMTDNDFFKMCHGKLNPQMAYIRKKMKIGGNFRKASIFTPDLFPKPTKENIEKYTNMVPKL